MPKAKSESRIKPPKASLAKGGNQELSNKKSKVSEAKISSRKTKKNQIIKEPESSKPLNPLKNFKINRKRLLIVLALVLLLILAYTNKKYFIAAMVNNQPITSVELSQTLNRLYGERILNQMINKKILEQEARSRGIVVTEQQINQKVAEVEERNGGPEVFESVLASNGLTRGEFIMQVSIQTLVEQLYKNEASPSAEEIQKIVDENSNAPEATEPAKFRQTIIDSLTQQKLESLASEKFQQLKQNAKISIF